MVGICWLALAMGLLSDERSQKVSTTPAPWPSRFVHTLIVSPLMQTTTQQFLTALHQGGAYSYWWTLEGRQSFWWEAGKPTALPGGTRNVYFGVHPTAAIPETDRHGKPVASRSVRSQIDQIAACACLFAEYDAKDFAGQKLQALDHIQTLEPRPSVVVDSGGGYHCYWLLTTPILLDTPQQRESMRAYQAAWVVLMGGDTAAKDLARVLRVPGTLNHKYTPPRPVVFVWCELDRTYEPDSLFDLAAPFVESTLPSAKANGTLSSDQQLQAQASKWLGNAVARVRSAPDGQKHKTLLAAATSLGGLVPIHLLTESEIESTLYAAIEGRAEDGKSAQETIRDGIAYGKAKPWPLDEILKSNGKAPGESEPAHTKTLHPKQELILSTLPDTITAASLASKVFDPLHWTVDGLLPEGACLLAAKPKAKKSWLALAIAIAVAMNGKALGHYDVACGDVLYLDLESNQRRMQSRLKNMIANTAWPDNLHIATKWGRGDDCLSMIKTWAEQHLNTRLIVIDILARVRPMRDPKADPYEQDYTFLQALNELAETLRITIVIIHHTRKAKAEDVFEEVSGTQAITGAVATIWMLTRSADNPDEQLLHLRGRDLIDEEPLAIKWDSYTCQHILVATGSEASSSAERRKILDVMDDESEYQLKELAALIGKTMKATDNHLRRLLDDNALQRTGRGRYAKVPKIGESAKSRGIRGIDGMRGYRGIDGYSEGESAPNSTSNSTIPRHSTTGHVELSTAPVSPETPQNGQFHEFHGISSKDDFWANVPPSRLTFVRLYLRGNKESDQNRARELCEEFGLDYEQAKEHARVA
jgi:hypothetical protein